jgi:NADH dehydrogenase FAD-containing subunit
LREKGPHGGELFTSIDLTKDEETKIVIPGGGFAGLATATYLDKRLTRRHELEVALISRENFILFTPMLQEVAAGDLNPSAGRVARQELNSCFDSYLDRRCKTKSSNCSITWHKERGRFLVNDFLQIAGVSGLWAVGDCATVPDGTGRLLISSESHTEAASLRKAYG